MDVLYITDSRDLLFHVENANLFANTFFTILFPGEGWIVLWRQDRGVEEVKERVLTCKP